MWQNQYRQKKIKNNNITDIGEDFVTVKQDSDAVIKFENIEKKFSKSKLSE